MGTAHLRYIREHKKAFYINLLTSGKLQSYLADINDRAEEMYLRLVKEMAERQKIYQRISKQTNL